MVWLAAIERLPVTVCETCSSTLRAAAARSQHGLGLRQEPVPGLGELDVAADAVEQMDAVLLFKRANSGRCGRLGNAQQLGRLGHVATLGDGDENPQLVQGHACIKNQYRSNLQEQLIRQIDSFILRFRAKLEKIRRELQRTK